MFGMAPKITSISFKTLESLKLHLELSALAIQHLFLTIILGACLVIAWNNNDLFNQQLLVIWTTASIICVLGALAINYVLSTEQHLIQYFYKKAFIYISSLLAGSFCAFIFYALNLPTQNLIQTNDALVLGALVLCLLCTHISAIIYLTYDYKVFFIFILITFTPTFKLNFILLEFSNNILLYQSSMIFYLLIMLILGYLMHRSNHLNAQKTFTLQKVQHQLQQDTLTHTHYTAQTLISQAELENKIYKKSKDIEDINARFERSHQNLEMAHETAGIASWDWDIQNRCVETGNFTRLFGYNIQSVNYYIKYLHKFIHPDDIDHVKYHMRQHLRGYCDRYEVTYRIVHQTDGWIWVHDLGRVTQRDPTTQIPLRMVGIRRNIDHQKKAEDRLTLSANVFKKMTQGIFVIDDQLKYIDANPYFLSLLDLTEEQLLGRYIFDVSENYRAGLHQVHFMILKKLLSDGEFEGEVIDRIRNGVDIPLWMHINAIYDQNERVTQYIGLVTDLTERKNSEKKLSYLQNYDTLTDLPNRHYFNNRLHSYLNETAKEFNKIAIIRLNLDRFRYYNELLNQQGGDDLLKEVAIRLRRVSADASVIARLNADDFAIILEVTDPHVEITEYCKGLIQCFDDSFKIKQQEFIITISVGVAIFPEHGRQMDSLNAHAEIALLEAKRIGGNAVRIYQNDKQVSSEPRLKLENALRKAVQNKELVLYFQPKINASSKEICGFEALIRWNHPEHGIIPPAQFIPLAEETSLISDIGKLALEMACSQIKKWSLLGFTDIRVAVNVVVQQIYRGQLINEIDYIIKKYAINPEQLELEITETSLMEDNENVRQVMQALHHRKIKVALDDFGIGYSSLSYLAQYSFDVIKIDRSFINGIGNPNKEAIIRAIIAMSKAMQKVVVAEGVESSAHYDFLIKEGCDYLQGYLLGKPMSADMATAMLQDNQPLHLVNL